MSESVVVRRDHHGVLLRYHSEAPVRNDPEHRPQPSDRERMRLLRAERALLTIKVIAEHLELSDIAMTRLLNELHAIQRALDLRRSRLGMSTPKAEELA